MVPLLPQNDRNTQARAEQLGRARLAYQYSYDLIDSLPMARSVPLTASPSLNWLTAVALAAFKILVNARSIDNDAAPGQGILAEVDTLTPTSLLAAADQVPVETQVSMILQQTAQVQIEGEGKAFSEYEALFATLALPAISQSFRKDAVFARWQVAGPNPLVLERISELPAHFPLTDAQYQSVMGTDDSLALAGAEGRLYLSDYAPLAAIVPGRFPDRQKYLWVPLALFALPQSADRKLQPVAIQCGQSPGPTAPLVIAPPPTDTGTHWDWQIAKTIVQVADANYHELISHLGLTHLVIEPFALATQRQLAANHPLGILLRPHFEGTLNINNLASRVLVQDRGQVDALLAGTIESSRALSVKAVQDFRFNQSMFPDTLRRRGVADPSLLPDYPYRDDGLLLWNAIHQWVFDYLSIYYKSDGDLAADFELQNWLTELLSTEGGRMEDIGEEGRMKTLAYLIDAVTLVIFTASVQHAAVNFPQRTLMSYAPAVPFAGYGPLPTEAAAEQDYFNLLPPRQQALGQLNLTFLLGSVYYTALGQYPAFEDPRLELPLGQFQRTLAQIEAGIDRRNLGPAGSLPPVYDYLRPSRIPQSINI